MWDTIILYLKFKLFNEKTAFVPRDNVIFYGISLKFMISQCSVRYYNIPDSSTVPCYILVRENMPVRGLDIPRQIHREILSHAWRVHHALLNNMAFASCWVCNFVFSYRRFDLKGYGNIFFYYFIWKNF
jgi:hypothetical protein